MQRWLFIKKITRQMYVAKTKTFSWLKTADVLCLKDAKSEHDAHYKYKGNTYELNIPFDKASIENAISV
jgi:hypothetical protein